MRRMRLTQRAEPCSPEMMVWSLTGRGCFRGEGHKFSDTCWSSRGSMHCSPPAWLARPRIEVELSLRLLVRALVSTETAEAILTARPTTKPAVLATSSRLLRACGVRENVGGRVCVDAELMEYDLYVSTVADERLVCRAMPPPSAQPP